MNGSQSIDTASSAVWSTRHGATARCHQTVRIDSSVYTKNRYSFCNMLRIRSNYLSMTSNRLLRDSKVSAMRSNCCFSSTAFWWVQHMILKSPAKLSSSDPSSESVIELLKNPSKPDFFCILAFLASSSASFFSLSISWMETSGIVSQKLKVVYKTSWYLFRFFGLDFTCSPWDDVQVDDGIENQQQVHRGNHHQIEKTRYDAPKLLRMETGCYKEWAR